MLCTEIGKQSPAYGKAAEASDEESKGPLARAAEEGRDGAGRKRKKCFGKARAKQNG